jgi:hypothetical protein
MYTLFNRYKKSIYLLLSVLVLFLLIKEALSSGDFRCYLNASIMLRDGIDPYADWIYINGDSYCLYFYSPLWAVLLIPFTYVNSFIPNMLWLLIRSWSLLLDFLRSYSLDEKLRGWVVFLSFLFTARFIQLDIALIQMTSFMLWTCVESIHQIRNGRTLKGAAILALGINIKILPIVFLPYLIYRGWFKAFFFTLFSLLSFLFLPALVLGWDSNIDLLGSWYQQIDPLKQQHMLETELGPHSLTAWIPTLLMETDGTLDLKRNILSLTLDQALLVLQLVRVFLIVLTVYFLSPPIFKPSTDLWKELRVLSYIFLVVPLIFPHQQKYAFVFMLPAAIFISHYLLLGWRKRDQIPLDRTYYIVAILFAVSFILATLTTDGLIGRDWNRITQHYKTITWGALLLVPALLIVKRKTIGNLKPSC